MYEKKSDMWIDVKEESLEIGVFELFENLFWRDDIWKKDCQDSQGEKWKKVETFEHQIWREVLKKEIGDAIAARFEENIRSWRLIEGEKIQLRLTLLDQRAYQGKDFRILRDYNLEEGLELDKMIAEKNSWNKQDDNQGIFLWQSHGGGARNPTQSGQGGARGYSISGSNGDEKDSR